MMNDCLLASTSTFILDTALCFHMKEFGEGGGGEVGAADADVSEFEFFRSSRRRTCTIVRKMRDEKWREDAKRPLRSKRSLYDVASRNVVVA